MTILIALSLIGLIVARRVWRRMNWRLFTRHRQDAPVVLPNFGQAERPLRLVWPPSLVWEVEPA